MEVVDVMPLCHEMMVALPYVKHLVGEYDKVGIYNELGLKAVIGGPPEAAPQIRDVAGDVPRLGLVIVHQDIQDWITITIANDKLIL